jgi:hypothetical protein
LLNYSHVKDINRIVPIPILPPGDCHTIGCETKIVPLTSNVKLELLIFTYLTEASGFVNKNDAIAPRFAQKPLENFH